MFLPSVGVLRCHCLSNLLCKSENFVSSSSKQECFLMETVNKVGLGLFQHCSVLYFHVFFFFIFFVVSLYIYKSLTLLCFIPVADTICGSSQNLYISSQLVSTNNQSLGTKFLQLFPNFSILRLVSFMIKIIVLQDVI